MAKHMSTKPKPFCFVLMPFEAKFNDIYEYGIKGACTDAGIHCERVDEQVYLGSILERIYSQIDKADLLVADMTGKNPNVFYEVGYAHALGKNVVLLTSVAEDIPFDLKHFPHIVYGSEIKTLQTHLTRFLKHLTSDESPDQAATKIGLEIFRGSEKLSDGNVIITVGNYRLGGHFTLLNASTRTYARGDFRIAVIAPPPFELARAENGKLCSVTKLQDGSYLHVLPEFDKLFPGAATSFSWYLETFGPNPDEFKACLRVFSDAGLRDFPITIRRT